MLALSHSLTHTHTQVLAHQNTSAHRHANTNRQTPKFVTKYVFDLLPNSFCGFAVDLKNFFIAASATDATNDQ